MFTDPLSDVLSLIRPETCVVGGLNLAGDWSLAFSGHQGVKYCAVVSGGCWLVTGEADPIRLETDDCVLLPDQRPFIMTRNPALTPMAFNLIPESQWRGGFYTLNGGGDTALLGGHFAFPNRYTDMLLGAMPGIVRLRDESDRAGVRWMLERLRLELTSSLPGRNLAIDHLAHLMLVQTLRLYLSCGDPRQSGWLFALRDSKIAPAITAIHADPGANWTLPTLAREAGMSRSKFADRFKTITGYAPIYYLTRWRMLLAAERLVKGNEPVFTIASSLGYQSEAAFSTAFRRVMGCAPRRYSTTQPDPIPQLVSPAQE